MATKPCICLVKLAMQLCKGSGGVTLSETEVSPGGRNASGQTTPRDDEIANVLQSLEYRYQLTVPGRRTLVRRPLKCIAAPLVKLLTVQWNEEQQLKDRCPKLRPSSTVRLTVKTRGTSFWNIDSFFSSPSFFLLWSLSRIQWIRNF